MCFGGWMQDKLDEGKICRKCDRWLGSYKRAALVIEISEKYENGRIFRTRQSICKQCLLQGKTPAEWAQGIVAKAKARKS